MTAEAERLIAGARAGDGATLVYATDHEPFWNASGRVSQHPGDERHITFLRGANLVIHDAQYTGDEYRDKVGWGHSSIEYAVDVALAAGVERLVLFHHDPAHDDTMMETMEAMARAHNPFGDGHSARRIVELLAHEIGQEA